MTAIATLRRADRRLDARGVARQSLAPDRRVATPLAELGERAVAEGLSGDGLTRFAAGLAELADAIVEHFPKNILWDLDHLAAVLARGACRHGAGWVGGQLDRAAELQRIYGRHTPIRFSYIHDFVYGFDWAKWVKRAPADRADVGPFDEIFLRYSERRGHELLALIAQRDEKYPPLADDRPRNPFGFSREPDAEVAIHRDLAARDLIPVEAWRWDAAPRFDRPFADLRRERAVALGFAR